jgi:hypothetical protein
MSGIDCRCLLIVEPYLPKENGQLIVNAPPWRSQRKCKGCGEAHECFDHCHHSSGSFFFSVRSQLVTA